MIRLHMLKGSSGNVGFHLSGHSFSAPRGRDIICASVSSLAQTAVMAFEHYKIDCRVSMSEEPAVLSVIAEDNAVSRIIMTSMLCGLTAISLQFPKYLKVIPYREVKAK